MNATREDLLRALRLSMVNAQDCEEFIHLLADELERIWIETGDEDVSLISRRMRSGELDIECPECPGHDADDCDECDDLSVVTDGIERLRMDIRALAADVARIKKEN